MIRTSWLVALASIGMAGAAQAQSCTCQGAGSTRIGTVALISAKLAGNTVCVPNGATWDWQEEHLGGPGATSGQLWDYKRGPGHAIDPRSQVGTWSISAPGQSTNGEITHSYTGGSSYVYRVCQGAATNSVGFCPSAGGAAIMSTVKAGTGTGCP
jgi:hypothetical protein